MVSGLTKNDYEDRLRELKLETLEERRHQSDMLMVHKAMHGKGNLEASTWFEKPGTNRAKRSGDEPYNIKKKYGRLELRNKFFSLRTIEEWNAIPAELKGESNTFKFKKQYKQLRATLMDHA